MKNNVIETKQNPIMPGYECVVSASSCNLLYTDSQGNAKTKGV